MRTVVATVAALALLAVAGAFAFIYSGIYDVAATRQHTAPVYWALQKALRRSITRHAQGIAAPDLSDPQLIARGLEHYRRRCVQCHGAPGVAPDDFALGMVPVPPPLVQTARELSAAEIFWVVKHGIKMTGMPAWDYRHSDPEIWAMVAFVMRLPNMAPRDYRATTASSGTGGGAADARSASR